jgi:hypothetical protein
MVNLPPQQRQTDSDSDSDSEDVHSRCRTKNKANVHARFKTRDSDSESVHSHFKTKDSDSESVHSHFKTAKMKGIYAHLVGLACICTCTYVLLFPRNTHAFAPLFHTKTSYRSLFFHEAKNGRFYPDGGILAYSLKGVPCILNSFRVGLRHGRRVGGLTGVLMDAGESGMYVYLVVCVYVYIYIYTKIHVYIYTKMYPLMYGWLRLVHAHTHVHIHMYIYT